MSTDFLLALSHKDIESMLILTSIRRAILRPLLGVLVFLVFFIIVFSPYTLPIIWSHCFYFWQSGVQIYTGQKPGVDDASCECVKPILDRLTYAYGLADHSSIPATPVSEAAEVDAETERLLSAMRENEEMRLERPKENGQSVTLNGYEIFHTTPSSSAIISPDKRSLLCIHPHSTMFKHGHGSNNVRVCCYRNDRYRVYILEDGGFAYVTVVEGAQLRCARRYLYKPFLFPPGPGVQRLWKAMDSEFILTGTPVVDSQKRK